MHTDTFDPRSRSLDPVSRLAVHTLSGTISARASVGYTVLHRCTYRRTPTHVLARRRPRACARVYLQRFTTCCALVRGAQVSQEPGPSG